MIEINISSLLDFTRMLFIMLLDGFLNSILAARMGDRKKTAYFIPLYGYYRFGVLAGIHPIWVIFALIASIFSSLWLYKFKLVMHLSINLVAIFLGMAIIGAAAGNLEKPKWPYAVGSFLLSLIAFILEPFIALFTLEISQMIMFYSLLLISIFVQIPKITLVLTTTKTRRPLTDSLNNPQT